MAGCEGAMLSQRPNHLLLAGDLAMTRSVPLWGLVLDATKCFDSLSVKGIGLAARHLGLRGELIGTLESGGMMSTNVMLLCIPGLSPPSLRLVEFSKGVP